MAAKKHCTTLCLPRQGWVGAMIYPAIKTRFMEMKIQFSHIAFLKEASTLSPLKWIFGSDQSDLEYNLWEMAWKKSKSQWIYIIIPTSIWVCCLITVSFLNPYQMKVKKIIVWSGGMAFLRKDNWGVATGLQPFKTKPKLYFL